MVKYLDTRRKGDTDESFRQMGRSLRFDRGVGGRGRRVRECGERRERGREGSGPFRSDQGGKGKGADAYTVSEAYEKAGKLDKKAVVVRGKVVKVSTGIMGKNWVHLRDGSGDPGKGTNNLVVTTLDVPKVGDVVTAKGTLYKDKDFGAGYLYKVIVEEATVTQ